MTQKYSPEERFDYFFIILGAILGILGGLLIGVPLWLATGYPDYVRLFFFLGIVVGGLIGIGLTGRFRIRKTRSHS